ncbi:MAG: hypothetical protein ACK52J_01835 [bacterium]
MLDFNYEKTKDRICLSLDCLKIIFELKPISLINMGYLLNKYNLFYRLAIVCYKIFHD